MEDRTPEMAAPEPVAGGKLVVEIDPKTEIVVDPSVIDEDGYVSLWNAASSTMNADMAKTRALASRFLGFLCKHDCDFVVASSTDAGYLDERFEREDKLLYNWNVDSENVDVVSQHAYVPVEGFKQFLKTKKFNPSTTYSPRRADRVTWFKDQWCVG